MRTTLTLDDDVAAMVAGYQKRTGARAKRIVNEAPDSSTGQYRVQPVTLGRCLLPGLDDVTDALASTEGDGFR
ncbi:MAG: hypothetical protein NT029_07435 [Armatimonadetes bacterium]|nr:hypothetical protein [Armatimonadota bacterium]